MAYEIALAILVIGVVYIFYKISRELPEEYEFIRLLYLLTTIWLCVGAIGIGISLGEYDATPADAKIIKAVTAIYRPIVYLAYLTMFLIVLVYIIKLVKSMSAK